jgi:hypothetical protein
MERRKEKREERARSLFLRTSRPRFSFKEGGKERGRKGGVGSDQSILPAPKSSSSLYFVNPR